MTNREELVSQMQHAIDELKFLRVAVDFDADRAAKAFDRAVLLLGSAAFVIACPTAFDLE